MIELLINTPDVAPNLLRGDFDFAQALYRAV
jgi:hypothetical protein